MAPEYNFLNEYDYQIKIIEKAAMELTKLGEKNDMPTVKTNGERILTSVKILKLNISDILESGI